MDRGREGACPAAEDEFESNVEDDGIVGNGGRESRVGEPVRVGEAGADGIAGDVDLKGESFAGDVDRKGESFVGDGDCLPFTSPNEVVRMTGLV